jgi:Leucine-rich repeat (LRR) protein
VEGADTCADLLGLGGGRDADNWIEEDGKKALAEALHDVGACFWWHQKQRVLPLAGCCEETALDLSHNYLREVPAGLLQLTQLMSLNVSNNQLQDLPIGMLTQLTSLDVRNNYLREVPAGLLKLTQLMSLDVSNNQLKQLTVGNWALLKSLNASKNQLERLPAGLLQLTQLMSLNVSNNQLQDLPIGRLAQITSLDVSNQLPVAAGYHSPALCSRKVWLLSPLPRRPGLPNQTSATSFPNEAPVLVVTE